MSDASQAVVAGLLVLGVMVWMGLEVLRLNRRRSAASRRRIRALSDEGDDAGGILEAFSNLVEGVADRGVPVTEELGPIRVQTPDRVPFEVVLRIAYRARGAQSLLEIGRGVATALDRAEKEGVAVLRSDASESRSRVRADIADVLDGALRRWARDPVRGPKSWEEAVRPDRYHELEEVLRAAVDVQKEALQVTVEEVTVLSAEPVAGRRPAPKPDPLNDIAADVKTLADVEARRAELKKKHPDQADVIDRKFDDLRERIIEGRR